MNRLDFLQLANELAANTAESHQRSAVSRAYYSAFNASKELIESCGLRFPKTAEAHEKVAWCMDASGDQELKVAKTKLHSLRQTRNDADYQLDDTQFQKPAFVAMQVGVAKQITDVIAAADARKAGFCPKVKAYAKNTLKLTVR